MHVREEVFAVLNNFLYRLTWKFGKIENQSEISWIFDVFPTVGMLVSINLVDNLRLISVCHSSQRHKNVCRLHDWQGTEAELPTACSECAHPSTSSYQDLWGTDQKRIQTFPLQPGMYGIWAASSHDQGVIAKIFIWVVCNRSHAELHCPWLQTEAWLSTMVALVHTINSVDHDHE